MPSSPSPPLPELYTRPSASLLLTALRGLQQHLPAFDGPAHAQDGEETFLDARERRQYLTSIISSPLAWLEDDAERDAVWEAASRRLSERAGRSAHPAHDRTLTIPTPNDGADICITLHEPTLTAENLGHKTWVAGYLLAKRLPLLSAGVPLLASHPASPSPASSPPLILELGAGTGLVGLALAQHLGPDSVAKLHLTDLEAIVPNLAANCARNVSSSSDDERIRVFPLDWYTIPFPPNAAPPVCVRTQTPVHEAQPGAYNLVVAADVLYGAEHPPLVAQAAAYFLQRNASARIVIECPRRERDGGLVEQLKQEMQIRKLSLISEGDEEGWEEMGSDEGRVKCWWGVWRWNEEAMREASGVN